MTDFKTKLTENMKPIKRKHYKAGHKYANTRLTSIQVGHSKLSSDTHKLGLSDTNLCPHCMLETRDGTALYYKMSSLC